MNAASRDALIIVIERRIIDLARWYPPKRIEPRIIARRIEPDEGLIPIDHTHHRVRQISVVRIWIDEVSNLYVVSDVGDAERHCDSVSLVGEVIAAITGVVRGWNFKHAAIEWSRVGLYRIGHRNVEPLQHVSGDRAGRVGARGTYPVGLRREMIRMSLDSFKLSLQLR